MAVLRQFLMMAARRAASDPQLQAKAAEIVREEVVPRVRQAAERARPHVEQAGRAARRTVNDLRSVGREHPPMQDPEGFARAAAARVRTPRGQSGGNTRQGPPDDNS